MSHRHVVVCDACGKESAFQTFGAWIRIQLGGEIIPSLGQVDLCSPACIIRWLREEADRRENT